MPLTKDETQEIVEQFGQGPNDTGNTEVQIALLTRRIEQLTEHFKNHKQDHNSRRGLLQLVGRRRRLLRYLSDNDLDRYRALLGRLGLRK